MGVGKQPRTRKAFNLAADVNLIRSGCSDESHNPFELPQADHPPEVWTLAHVFAIEAFDRLVDGRHELLLKAFAARKVTQNRKSAKVEEKR